MNQAKVEAALAKFLEKSNEYVLQKGRKSSDDDDDDFQNDDKPSQEEGEKTTLQRDASDGPAVQEAKPETNRFRYIKFNLREVNPHIVCKLCAGYFIGATTITECLHTFCKSCIIKYFQAGHDTCPTCEEKISQFPLDALSQDRTIQNVVYKIVKDLQRNEKERERAFNEKSGVTQAILPGVQSDAPPPKKAKIEQDTDEANEDLINFKLVYNSKASWDYSDGVNQKIKELEKPYIRTSSQATIKHVKRLLALKLELNSHDEVDILCRGQLMGREHKLQFIQSTLWRGRKDLLLLEYRQKCDIDQI